MTSYECHALAHIKAQTIPRWLHEFMMGHNDFTRVTSYVTHLIFC